MEERPNWVPEEYNLDIIHRGLYTLFGTITMPSRGSELIYHLQQFVSERNLQVINYLEVGVGSAGIFQCPYEPYNIAALLENLGLEYKGVIVDRNKEVLKNLQQRENIYFHYNPQSIFSQEDNQAWRSYLDLTKQVYKETSVDHPDIIVNNILGIPLTGHFLKQRLLKNGVAIAKVPTTFANKLENGEVTVVEADIATAQLEPHSPFDFVSCMNVFSYLNSDGQKLALYNMATNMDSEGMLVINGFQNGWLSTERLRDIKLEQDSEITTENPGIFILRKY